MSAESHAGLDGCRNSRNLYFSLPNACPVAVKSPRTGPTPQAGFPRPCWVVTALSGSVQEPGHETETWPANTPLARSGEMRSGEQVKFSSQLLTCHVSTDLSGAGQVRTGQRLLSGSTVDASRACRGTTAKRKRRSWGRPASLKGMTLHRSTEHCIPAAEFNHREREEPVPTRGTLERLLLRTEQTGRSVVYAACI